MIKSEELVERVIKYIGRVDGYEVFLFTQGTDDYTYKIYYKENYWYVDAGNGEYIITINGCYDKYTNLCLQMIRIHKLERILEQ